MGFGFVALYFGLAVAFAKATFPLSSSMNPACVVADWILGNITRIEVLPLIASQIMGAFLGAILMYLTYLPHYLKLSTPKCLQSNQEHDALSTFCCRPQINHLPCNFICEFLCTFVLTFGLITIHSRIDPLVSSLYSSGLSAFIDGMYIATLIGVIGGPTGMSSVLSP